MAEIATGVLHNVGNVLNSINVSATLASDRIRQSKVTELVRAVDLMKSTCPTWLLTSPRIPRASNCLSFSACWRRT